MHIPGPRKKTHSFLFFLPFSFLRRRLTGGEGVLPRNFDTNWRTKKTLTTGQVWFFFTLPWRTTMPKFCFSILKNHGAKFRSPNVAPVTGTSSYTNNKHEIRTLIWFSEPTFKKSAYKKCCWFGHADKVLWLEPKEAFLVRGPVLLLTWYVHTSINT